MFIFTVYRLIIVVILVDGRGAPLDAHHLGVWQIEFGHVWTPFFDIMQPTLGDCLFSRISSACKPGSLPGGYLCVYF